MWPNGIRTWGFWGEKKTLFVETFQYFERYIRDSLKMAQNVWLVGKQTTVGKGDNRAFLSPFQLRIYRRENYKVGGGDWI